MAIAFASLHERLFYQALRIRLVEQRLVELYPSDAIQSPVHLSVGQEAVAVGACEALAREDLLFGSYRSHAFYLAKGGDLGAMLAELCGKATGSGGGKAGSMHLAAPDVGFMGSSAIVASTIPHAVGAALATQRLGTKRIAVAVFGDGATEEGVYHESLNFAALHRLPVLFLCENNGLAVHSTLAARQAYRITAHAEAYGLPTSACEAGADFDEVHRVVLAAVTAVRRGEGPRLVECRTYRWLEHVGIGEDFDAGYRTRAEFEAWRAHDPLVRETALVARFAPAIRAEIAAAEAFAEASPWPAEDELLTDVA
jgi:TPP-dependent pyruvate/acetoin dehydrogenase alpha subunit